MLTNDIAKAFDPEVLEGLDYIDMSGAQLLKSSNSNSLNSLSSTASRRNSTDMDTYSPGLLLSQENINSYKPRSTSTPEENQNVQLKVKGYCDELSYMSKHGDENSGTTSLNYYNSKVNKTDDFLLQLSAVSTVSGANKIDKINYFTDTYASSDVSNITSSTSGSKQDDETYVTIYGSPTYLAPHCKHCNAINASDDMNSSIQVTCDHNTTDYSMDADRIYIDNAFICDNYESNKENNSTSNDKDNTYMTIGSVESMITQVPPQLPERNNKGKPVATDSNYCDNNSSKSDRKCKIARVQAVLPIRPREEDVLLDKCGHHSYTVKQIFDSVNSLTSELQDSLNDSSMDSMVSVDSINQGKYYHNTSMEDSFHSERYNSQIYKSSRPKSILKCKSDYNQNVMKQHNNKYPYHRTQKQYQYNDNRQQEDYYSKPYEHHCILEEEPYTYTSHTRTASISSSASIDKPGDDVKLPIKKNRTKRRRSFLEHIGSVSNMINSSKSRPRLYSSSEYSSHITRNSPFRRNTVSGFTKSSLAMQGLKSERFTAVHGNVGGSSRTLYGEPNVLHRGFINPMSRETCF